MKRYAVSVLFVCTATTLTIAIKSFFAGKGALIFFTIAVILSVAYGFKDDVTVEHVLHKAVADPHHIRSDLTHNVMFFSIATALCAEWIRGLLQGYGRNEGDYPEAAVSRNGHRDGVRSTILS